MKKWSSILLLSLLSFWMIGCATNEGTNSSAMDGPDLIAFNITGDAAEDTPEGLMYISGLFFTDPRINFLNNLPPNTYRIYLRPTDGTRLEFYPARPNVNTFDEVVAGADLDLRYIVEYTLAAPSDLATFETTADERVVVMFNRAVGPQEQIDIDLQISLSPNPDNLFSSNLSPIDLTVRMRLYGSENDVRILGDGTEPTDYEQLTGLTESYNILRAILTNHQAGAASEVAAEAASGEAESNYSTNIVGFTNFVPYVSDYGLLLGSAYPNVLSRDEPATGADQIMLQDFFGELLRPVDATQYRLTYKLFLDPNLASAQRQLGIVVPPVNERSEDVVSDSTVFRRGNDYAARIGIQNIATMEVERYYTLGISVAADPVTSSISVLDPTGTDICMDGSVDCGLSKTSTNILSGLSPGTYTFELKGTADADARFVVIDENDQILPLVPLANLSADDHPQSKQFTVTLQAGTRNTYKLLNIVEGTLMAQDADCQARKDDYFTFSAQEPFWNEDCRFYEAANSPAWIQLIAN